MSASRTARERVRAELTREIADIARRQLGTEGAIGLSLRAVAREMGMVSSAVYRYFPSKDDLLTTLIIDAYNALGETVEQADAATPRDDHAGRWLAVCRAVREWAVAHPHEYALLYGSPVPGYQAPEDTVAAALRDTIVFGRIIEDAYAAGALTTPEGMPPLSPALAEDLARVRRFTMQGVPDEVAARGLTAWTGLFGAVSFEVFGQYNNIIDRRAELFEHHVICLARLIGL